MIGEKSPYARAKAAGLTAIKRWEEGREHHPKSLEIVRFMAAHDAKDCEDSLDIKMGGDGDNGEAMAFMLDAYFELMDLEAAARKKKKPLRKRQGRVDASGKRPKHVFDIRMGRKRKP